MTDTVVVIGDYPHAVQFDAMADRFGWLPVGMAQRSIDHPVQTIWKTLDGAYVRFIDDHIVGVSLVVIHGPHGAAAERAIRGAFLTATVNDVLQAAQFGVDGQRAQAIRALAAVGVECSDPAIHDQLIAAVDDDEKAVRLAAIRAIARIGSAAFMPIITRRVILESDAALRSEVAALYDASRALYSQRA